MKSFITFIEETALSRKYVAVVYDSDTQRKLPDFRMRFGELKIEDIDEEV